MIRQSEFWPPEQTLQFANQLLANYRLSPKEGWNIQNFGKLTSTIADIIRYEYTNEQREDPILREFLRSLAYLRDAFGDELRRCPAIGYVPAHDVAEAFHRSSALWRYFRAGNRSSKTQSGYMEDFWFATGTHPYRVTGGFPAAVAILAGLPLKDYGPKVFQLKMIEGEEGNTLSPLFPVDGKWFYHHDPRKHIITLGCPDCAAEGKAQSCPSHHPKSRIYLLSSEQGVGVLEAFQARLVHIDEHVPEEFYHAIKMRTASVNRSAHLLTGTPLHGEEAWESELMARVAEGPLSENLYINEDGIKCKRVELFQISQIAAGLVPKEKIKADAADMDEFEYKARILGEPAPLARNPVFDRAVLNDMAKITTEPRTGQLSIIHEQVDGEYLTIDTALYSREIEFTEQDAHSELWSGVHVWEEPQPGGQYLIGVDTAKGLMYKKGQGGKIRAGDASCAMVVKIDRDPLNPGDVKYRIVAKYYGWTGVLDYADEVKKLAVWYNTALVVVELTGGLGSSVVERLRMQLKYPNIFRDTSNPELFAFGISARFGLDTNQATKPKMVGWLQHAIKERLVDIPCKSIISELVAFEQERSPTGKTTQYGGAGGSRDDQAMALVISIYTIMTYPIDEYSLPPDQDDKDREGPASTYDPNELLEVFSG